MSSELIRRRRAEVSAREFAEGGVLVNMRSGECFELNRLGFEVWNALDGVRDIAHICEPLATRYSVHVEQLIADVEALIHALDRAGLVEPPRAG